VRPPVKRLKCAVSRRAAAVLAGLACAGCAERALELLVAAEEDPCSELITQSACDEEAELGCSWQPNDVGCLSTDPTCAPGRCAQGDPFVRRVEDRLLLNGRSFRFVGVGSWALLQPGACGWVDAAESQAWLEEAFDGLVQARISVVRAYGFQSSAGSTGDDYWWFDAAVNAARRAGVRLMFYIENQTGECSSGEWRSDAWYQQGHAYPYGSYAHSYLDHARALAERYRDEPTVLGYTLVQGLRPGDAELALSFASEVGQLLHGVAPNQLISLDLRTGWDASDASLFRQAQELSVVDLMDVVDYPEPWEHPEPLLTSVVEAVRAVNKPRVIGEGAFQLFDDSEQGLIERAERAEQRMLYWQELGFQGALLWNYQPGWLEISEEFDARPADPLLRADGVLARAPW